LKPRSLLALLIGTAVAACGLGEVESPEAQPLGTAQAPLLLDNQVTLWSPHGYWNTTPIQVPICWVTAGYVPEKEVMANALRHTWGRVAPIDFTFEECSATTAPRVRVMITSGDGGSARAGFISNSGVPSLTTGGYAVHLAIGPISAGFSRDRLRYLAVHEFGHVLGFQHEQDSPSRTTTSCSIDSDGNVQNPWPDTTQLGPWDADSVMNYCNRYGNNLGYLSPGDIAGVRQIYGTRKVRNKGDFNGDSTADLGFWRPLGINGVQNGTWNIVPGFNPVVWGVIGDVAVPGDYDGDGTTNRAIWRPSTGQWWISDGVTPVISWGVQGDIPVPGDYDGDGTMNRAIWRPSTGQWWIHDGVTPVTGWGVQGDIPVPADYDGDGKTDIAIWRPSTGRWWIRTAGGALDVTLGGGPGDIPVPGDYAGEGKARPALYVGPLGLWMFHAPPATLAPGQSALLMGQSGDIPVPASYSGNGITEPAVWHPAPPGQSRFRIFNRPDRFWGEPGDTPLPKNAGG
jgi:hypothetical protein